MPKLTPHPFVSTPRNGPCSSCGKKRTDPIHISFDPDDIIFIGSINEFLDVIEESTPGRTCQCEDYPCCGH